MQAPSLSWQHKQSADAEHRPCTQTQHRTDTTRSCAEEIQQEVHITRMLQHQKINIKKCCILSWFGYNVNKSSCSFGAFVRSARLKKTEEIVRGSSDATCLKKMLKNFLEHESKCSCFFMGSKTMTINLCFIKEEYFMQHSTFMNMLDPGNLNKQNHRTHLCLVVESDENKFYIPLRNNLGAELRKFGRIGHAVPSKNRPSAGWIIDMHSLLMMTSL